jgi:phosphoglycerol transferase MdoB-like AlkP superfamily enzyme
MERKPYQAIYQKVSLQLVLVLILFQVSRLLFFLLNTRYFQSVSMSRYLSLAAHGIRFDLSALFIINALYLIIQFIPFSFGNKPLFQKLVNGWFLLSNTIAFMFDLADIGYFPFVRKRMTAEVFHLLGKKSDFIDLLPSYLREFWFVPIAAICFIAGFVFLFSRINRMFRNPQPKTFSLQALLFFVMAMGLSFFFIRGGLQFKPIMNFNALLVANNEEVPLVLNTPFSILHTLQDHKLERLHDVSDSDMLRYCNPIKHYVSNQQSKSCNVVVLIVESLGKQYTGIGGRKSYTPFLDSLMKKSLVCTNAFANGHRSADGIPACLAGIPTFMDEAFTTSPYSQNQIDGLPALLNKVGYATSFYHGGTNGTMSFDIFARNAGFEKYVGRTEYNHDADYDGTWGIWDEPFLQFYANDLGKQQQPFFSSVFTLSSHEPFKLPPQYAQSSFAQLKGIERGISYADEALRKFFQTASSKAWYSNTLFVITPDHNFLANIDSAGYYNHGVGLYAIPVILFNPSDPYLKGVYQPVFQQIDILPTVLDYLHYQLPFFAYGNSAFDTSVTHWAYTQMGDHTQMLSDGYVVVADQMKYKGVYDLRSDSLLLHILPNDSVHEAMMTRLKAFKQLLQNSLIDNKQTQKTWMGL